MRSKPRVVITGVGPVTPLGTGKEEFWSGICAGKSVYGLIDDGFLKVPEKLEERLHRLGHPNAGRTCRLAATAAALAIQDAHLEPAQLKHAGVFVGDGNSDLATVRDAPHTDMAIQYMLLNSLPGSIATAFNIGGPSSAISAACATGVANIGAAYDQVILGRVPLVLAGAATAAVHNAFLRDGYLAMRHSPLAAGKSYETTPFGISRGQFQLSEAGGVLVVEELSHALARGSHIYAELVGYGSATETGLAVPRVSKDGYYRAMAAALHDANVNPENLDAIWVNAHGTATVLNDREEAGAIEKLFSSLPTVLVSSYKGLLGHSQGASTAVETIVGVLALERGLVPAMNTKELDPSLPQSLSYVTSTRSSVPWMIKNAAGFHGTFQSLLLKQYYSGE